MINNEENVTTPYFLLYSIHTIHLQVLMSGSLQKVDLLPTPWNLNKNTQHEELQNGMPSMASTYNTPKHYNLQAE
jgi:hypothetical protein